MGDKSEATWHGSLAEVRSFETGPDRTALVAYCPQHGVVGTLWAVTDSRYPGPANSRARIDAHDHNDTQHRRSTMPIVPDPTPRKSRRSVWWDWWFPGLLGALGSSTGWLIVAWLDS